MSASIVWATPDLDSHLGYIARVSNPDNQSNPKVEGLLRHMMEEGHASPFAMVNVCVEVNTTRDIGRQILRHWSISPQEFSQRYQTVDKLGDVVIREFREQHPTNRQASVEVAADDPRNIEWRQRQESLALVVRAHYEWCLANGGAKEVARVVLPEGMTPSRLYLNGTMRSWIHYLMSRLHDSTQKEHRMVAQEIVVLLRTVAPVTMGAFFPVDGAPIDQ